MSLIDRAFEDALDQSERILSLLGLRMTLGSDFEWMSVLNPEEQTRSIHDLQTQALAMLHQLHAHPAMPSVLEAFSPWFGELAHANEVTLEHIERLDQRLPLNSLVMLLDVLQQTEAQQVDVGAFFTTSAARHYQAGAAEAQQHELATGLTYSPNQLVQWMRQTQNVLREAANKVGLSIDARDAPAFSTFMHGERKSVTNGTHVHFGLQTEQGANAIVSGEPLAWNQLYEHVSTSLVNMLRDGGSFFSLPNEASYRRKMSHRLLAVDVREAKIGCIRDIRDNPDNWHWELTLAGASTPPLYAVLIPALAMVDGAARAMGLDLTACPDDMPMLDYIEGAIARMPEHERRKKMQAMCAESARGDAFFTHDTMTGVPKTYSVETLSAIKAPASRDEAWDKLQGSRWFDSYFPEILSDEVALSANRPSSIFVA